MYIPAHRTKPKKKGMVLEKKNIRQLNKSWRSMSFLRNNVKIDNLFDIGKNMESLTGNEKVFYNDQNDKRKFRLSEEIDIEYEIEKQQELEMEREMMEQQADEYRYMMDDCDEETSNISVPDQINVSLNRSGLTRNCASSVDSSTQTEFVVNRPKIRKVRDCSNAIKSTCAEVSVKCNISTDCSRIAVQTVSNGLYIMISKQKILTHSKII